jgi:hypothetical protein
LEREGNQPTPSEESMNDPKKSQLQEDTDALWTLPDEEGEEDNDENDDENGNNTVEGGDSE